MLLDLAAGAAEHVFGFRLGVGDALVGLVPDPLDSRIGGGRGVTGLGLRHLGALRGLRQLLLQGNDELPGLDLQPGHAVVGVGLDPFDPRIGIGLDLVDRGFDVGPQPTHEPVRVLLELGDASLSVAQLGRQLLRQRHGAVAVLVGHIHGLLRLVGEGRFGRNVLLARSTARRRRKLTLTHDAHDDDRCSNSRAVDSDRAAPIIVGIAGSRDAECVRQMSNFARCVPDASEFTGTHA